MHKETILRPIYVKKTHISVSVTIAIKGIHHETLASMGVRGGPGGGGAEKGRGVGMDGWREGGGRGGDGSKGFFK